MTDRSAKLTAAVETYLAELGRLRASGGATSERSSYGPLAKLLDAVGATLKPNVFCVVEPANQGAGHPCEVGQTKMASFVSPIAPSTIAGFTGRRTVAC